MSTTIDYSTINKLIEHCCKKVEIVLSNKEVCAVLADDLESINEFLNNLDSTEKANADKYKLQRVMSRLYRITSRTKVLFDRCTHGKKFIKIRNFFSTIPIKQELLKLHEELPEIMSMLHTVFHKKKAKAFSRGPQPLPTIDESLFDKEDEEDNEAAEEYYLNDDD
ncbi:hypothetical protein I4U23_020025 [Adineta vaga]|nr:hypothetical protein I4U23_020025 [Adineta vaga]